MTTYGFYHIHRTSNTAWCGACHQRLPDDVRWGDACPLCDTRLGAVSIGCVRTCQHCRTLFVADTEPQRAHCSRECHLAWNRQPILAKQALPVTPQHAMEHLR